MTAVADEQTIPRSAQGARLGRILLSPESVAIVGASDDSEKTAARPLKFMMEGHFQGRIYPINPRRETTLGHKAWPSLRDLPEVPEFVFIVTDTKFVVETARECGELGVSVICVLSGGFGEDGPEGLKRQAELLQVAREFGLRILGPNSIGVVNPGNGFLATANAAFAETNIPGGTTLVASQSGSVIGALMTRAKARGIGFAGLVSTGMEIDLTLGEICESTLEDPSVTSYALFLESLDNAESLVKFAHKAAKLKKGVTVYKLGRSDAAAQLSVSHTGALAGEDDEADALFRACGFVRVDNFEALIEAAILQTTIELLAPGRRARIGIITSTGGGAAILVDQLEMRGVDVARPSDSLFAQIEAAGITVGHNLIVDLTLAGTRHDKVLEALGAMQNSGEFDLIIFVIGSSARLHPELAVRAIAESVSGRTPVGAWALPDALASLSMLHAAGVPAFRTPESCADAVAGVFRRQEIQHEALANFAPRESDNGLVLNEVESAQLLAEVGVKTPESWIVALEPGGVPDSAFPVVLKALSRDLPHKSDAGAVILNVANQEQLEAAKGTITTNVAVYNSKIVVDQFLVQKMISNTVLELLIGYRVSPSVGPVVVLAAGGIYVELYKDSTLRLAPVTEEIALDMIAEVKAVAIARGFRSGPIGDVAALAKAIVAMSTLALADKRILEAEANPLVVLEDGQGVLALDALIRISDEVLPSPQESPFTSETQDLRD